MNYAGHQNPSSQLTSTRLDNDYIYEVRPRTRAAFASHDSQWSWDSHLCMILSRYVWFNDLKRIPGRGSTA
ncbi:hypothetical protein HRG_012670 [Hirsutella rhossiliensis]